MTSASSSHLSAARWRHLSQLLEPNLNLFPTAIQNGHINLIIRCVIRLADERLSLDGIKSVCPLFVDPTRWYKIGKGVGDGVFCLQTSNGHVFRAATPLLIIVIARSVHLRPSFNILCCHLASVGFTYIEYFWLVLCLCFSSVVANYLRFRFDNLSSRRRLFEPQRIRVRL